MVNNFDNKNTFEQNISSEAFNNIVGRHMKHLNEVRERVAERTRSYPPTYGEYSVLALNDRLAAAISIFQGEVSGKRRGFDAPKNPFTFDISSLSDIKTDSLGAQIIYSEGSWTNALNDTHVTKPPHLSIDVKTSLAGNNLNDHLADLEAIRHYEENDYKNYNFDHMTFRVVERGFKKEYISDPDDPLFQDVVRIIDTGIEALYKEKLASRIEKLCNIAINS